MNNKIIKILIDGLYGKNTHVEPQKSIKGLTPTNAKIKPLNDYHSCWESIHHIVVWQEAILEAIRGNKVNWRDISKNKNWPKEEFFSEDSNFTNLVKKFENGLIEAEEMIKTVDLDKPIPDWDDAPILQAFIVLLQHNSYHIGQIIAVRKILGI